ncbi:MAG TPA: bifunctional alpha,alpha-trehalose-phosphate synthase (UDP-forming)/trehalose-phosphatase, partial [Bacteroidota bacterium]|nr:bifunctional alpha,alpha-trehalose-phosphate synthase (UDP-forming)/trehalose-phosphatase [Bacteroidota bacterium]
LFHYFPTVARFDDDAWRQYRHVNEVYCDAVLGTLRPGDVVWVHDYHLMLLPGLLRRKRPGLTVGFFLHIPFPDFEIFRLLPDAWRKEILSGMLGADLVGFHTYAYTQHFLQCVQRLLGFENNFGAIVLPARLVKAETYPMGIDFDRFNAAAGDPAVRAETQALAETLTGRRIILSVDRLDYTKGILNRLLGYERLLEDSPSFRNSVVLVMVIVPSRIAVEHYAEMKKLIEEEVGRINGKYGSVGWTPVIYQYRSLSFAPLAALYASSDVALVTPLRDGMNLVAKEYVASRREGTGVLVLSEMAGAAKELGEALLVNPYKAGEIAGALREALEMPRAEQQRRNRILRNRLRRYDVARWANEFLDQLQLQKQAQVRFETMVLPPSGRRAILESFAGGEKRLVLLDYDGTLAPIAPRPSAAKPTTRLLALLARLAGEPGTTLAILSGRDRSTLGDWLGDIPCSLAAEHGAWIREAHGEWRLLREQRGDWKPRILPILEKYMDRLPGAFIEEKDYSLAWHFRGAHPEQAEALAGEMVDHLMNLTANIDVQVLRGKKVVEVRSAGIDKGVAALHWLTQDHYDFIFAAGDDWTDEDMFAVLPETSFSIRVGYLSSRARFNLGDTEDVLLLLEELAGSLRPAGVVPGPNS